jgi:hypothetical protein
MTIGEGWEQDLVSFYEQNYSERLRALGFEFYEKREGPGMGASLTFHLPQQDFFICLVNDRSQFLVDVGVFLGGRSSWDLLIVYSLLAVEEGKWDLKDTDSRRRILLPTLDERQQADFFFRNADKIIALFSHTALKRTGRRLKELQLERSRYMFG